VQSRLQDKLTRFILKG